MLRRFFIFFFIHECGPAVHSLNTSTFGSWTVLIQCISNSSLDMLDTKNSMLRGAYRIQQHAGYAHELHRLTPIQNSEPQELVNHVPGCVLLWTPEHQQVLHVLQIMLAYRGTSISMPILTRFSHRMQCSVSCGRAHCP